ncbi:hypothetical protein BJY00DRAFT_266188 [Aspergillus carlsbadensis]|nr:hypothetical protein BJY00DRAFT_266188 [Aspergillus carlsbadensis]
MRFDRRSLRNAESAPTQPKFRAEICRHLWDNPALWIHQERRFGRRSFWPQKMFHGECSLGPAASSHGRSPGAPARHGLRLLADSSQNSSGLRTIDHRKPEWIMAQQHGKSGVSIKACLLLVLARPRRSIAGSAADPESTRCCPPSSRDPAAQICTSLALRGPVSGSSVGLLGSVLPGHQLCTSCAFQKSRIPKAKR